MIRVETPLSEKQQSFSSLSLGNAQREFSKLVTHLLVFAHSNGYSVTFGDAYRDPRVFNLPGAYGRKTSNHKKRLSIDLNIFKDVDSDGDQDYLRETKDHAEIGEFWESIGGYWGGRHDDGNHYSIYYRGFW